MARECKYSRVCSFIGIEKVVTVLEDTYYRIAGVW